MLIDVFDVKGTQPAIICSKLTIEQNKVWNMFKVNNKDIRTTRHIEHISHLVLVFYIVNFKQVNAGWVINA